MNDSTSRPPTIAILGGGISGLSAMYALAGARESGAPVRAMLMEASGRWGGLIRTEKVDGFTMEAGPDSFLTAKPEALDLCRELGLESELIGSNDSERRTYVLYRGKLRPLPDGLLLFIPARLWPALFSPLFPFRSKLAMIRDFFRTRGTRSGGADEPVAEFVRRHFGTGPIETLVDPLLAGIYGGDSAELSAHAVLPGLVEIDRGSASLVRGVISARRRAPRVAPLFTTLTGGLETLPRAMVARLAASPAAESLRLLLNHHVELIEATASGAPVQPRYRIHCSGGAVYEADAVVLALPAPESARLLQRIDRQVSESLAGISYTPAATVSLAYPSISRPLPRGFGFLVSGHERRRMLATTFVHAKFQHRAPAGGALLRCFFGGSRHPELWRSGDEDLVEMSSEELRDILSLPALPALHTVWRSPAAMPQYLVGHLERVSEIECGIRRCPGIFLAGNAYRGVGISDCIRSGRTAAEKAVQYIGNK